MRAGACELGREMAPGWVRLALAAFVALSGAFVINIFFLQPITRRHGQRADVFGHHHHGDRDHAGDPVGLDAPVAACLRE